jgi:uncharacterized protein
VAYPTGIGIVDAMIGFPIRNHDKVYARLRRAAKDRESKEDFAFPAEYMFKDVPDSTGEGQDPIAVTFAEMDRFGIETGLFGLSPDALDGQRRDPKRVALTLEVNPNDVLGATRKVRAAKADHDVKAVTFFPAGCLPQVPVDDPKAYALYAACVDLDLAVVVNAGIAGPRMPSDCQHVMRFDRVCYDFPELRIVMRHGAEPWEDLAVKLMLKWHGLHYMTSAFAPKYYPKAVIDYANTRGAHKVMYAGYYPMGLSLQRIFDELPHVPLRDHVWEPFLRDNAHRVFQL